MLTTLVLEPRFEFYPLRMAVSGRANIERFYREQYPKFASMVVDFEVIGEWTNEIAALQEYTIDVAQNVTTTRYHVISMMPGDDAADLLMGERLYCDEGFVRALLGPLFDALEPVD